MYKSVCIHIRIRIVYSIDKYYDTIRYSEGTALKFAFPSPSRRMESEPSRPSLERSFPSSRPEPARPALDETRSSIRTSPRGTSSPGRSGRQPHV